MLEIKTILLFQTLILFYIHRHLLKIVKLLKEWSKPEAKLNKPTSVKIKGNYAYVKGNDDDAEVIIDISDPKKPFLREDLL